MKQTLTEFMDEKYANREDKDNIYGVGISDKEFIHFIIQYLLGENYYISDPIGPTQVNEVVLYEILKIYSKSYQKELKINNQIRHAEEKYSCMFEKYKRKMKEKLSEVR